MRRLPLLNYWRQFFGGFVLVLIHSAPVKVTTSCLVDVTTYLAFLAGF